MRIFIIILLSFFSQQIMAQDTIQMVSSYDVVYGGYPVSGGGGIVNISEASDVDLASVSIGDRMQWDGTNWIPDIRKYYYIDKYCFEENSGLGGAGEWSVGNGSTGAGVAIPIHTDAELIGMMFQAETFGTSATMALRLNRSITTNDLIFTTDGQTQYYATPISLSVGDIIAPETEELTGTFTDGRACLLVKYEAILE